MKKILTLIIMISALLSQGVVYLDYGMNSEYEVSNNYETESYNLDAPISIGYYYPVYRVADNMIFSAGGSYEIVPAVEKSYGENFEIGFIVFVLPKIKSLTFLSIPCPEKNLLSI